MEISGERDVIRECWKDNGGGWVWESLGGYIGQKIRVGVEAMCVEIDSTWVIKIKKSKDGKWLKSIEKLE